MSENFEDKRKGILWEERVYDKAYGEEPIGIFYKGIGKLETLIRQDERERIEKGIAIMIGRRNDACGAWQPIIGEGKEKIVSSEYKKARKKAMKNLIRNGSVFPDELEQLALSEGERRANERIAGSVKDLCYDCEGKKEGIKEGKEETIKEIERIIINTGFKYFVSDSEKEDFIEELIQKLKESTNG